MNAKLLFLRARYLLIVEVLDLDLLELVLLHMQKLSKLENIFFHYTSFPVKEGISQYNKYYVVAVIFMSLFLMNFFDRKDKTTTASGVKTYESFPSKKIKKKNVRRSVQNLSQEAIQAQFMS